ncbi:hypothetical protein RKD38_000050 [Streptomyces ambofaciens]
MPIRHARPLPVATMHRDTLLDSSLSPTSRLLYAVLIACSDGTPLPEIAALVGILNGDSVDSYLSELEGAGVVETGDHACQRDVLTVHEMPVAPAKRSHPCVPCARCSKCSCEYEKGICRVCDEIRRVDLEAAADVARWKRQLAAGATYAIGQSGNRLHRWDCPTLNSAEKGLQRLQGAEDLAKYGAYYWSRLPNLYTAEELRLKGMRKRHCGVCGPTPV